VVAVIDTGVDLAHEDLSLVSGYDAVHFETDGGPSSRGAARGDAHGTACAGIVAAIRDNGMGVAGVAPGVRVMPVRVMYMSGAHLIFEFEWAIDGIQWAVDHGAHVLSNSWHSLESSDLTYTISYALRENRVLVFATGNGNSSVKFPASLPGVIAVGASSPCDTRKSPRSCDADPFWGSNYGQRADLSDRWPDVVAPGVMIFTTDMTGRCGYNMGNYTALFGGTSAAVPHVAGVAALLLSRNPSLTPEEVRRHIMQSADDIGRHGPDQSTGAGRLNAHQALRAIR